MFAKFASLAQPEKYGYSYDTSKWTPSVNPFLIQEFRMFETGGDGLIQHSNCWPVGEANAIDYLESLCVAMLADPDLADEVGVKFNYKPTHDFIKFAASLVFNEEKDRWPNKLRYFSVSEQKVTRSETKKHDKRYEELRDWHNGSPEAVYRMILPQYAEGLMQWQYANEIRYWFRTTEQKKSYMDPAAVFLKWFRGDDDKAREFHNAFDACRDVCESVRRRRNAENHVKFYQASLERAKQPKQEVA